jgi:hypothetical protein
LSTEELGVGKDFSKFYSEYKTYTHSKIWKNFSIGGSGIAVIAALLILLNSTTPEKYVKPPFDGMNIPYSEYLIGSDSSSLIISPSGSRIHIPKNAFLNVKGKNTKGPIRIKYREFRDPAEIFIAGIPMTYDSAGKQFHFESAGMFEILAFDGEQPVFINPEKMIMVELASLSPEDKFNTYYLDTVKKNWEYISKDSLVIPQIKEAVVKNLALMPVLSDPSKFRLSIEADSDQFPELVVYAGVKFQVSDENTTFDPEWAVQIWDNATLTRNEKSQYVLIVEKNGEHHDIIVDPVFDGKDYENAVRDFQKKITIYNSLLEVKNKKENEVEKKMENQLNYLDSIRVEKNEQLATGERFANERASAEQLVFRVFMVNKFGMWNSDCPSSLPQGVKLLAKFADPSNNSLTFESVYLVEKGRNAIFTYNSNYLSAFTFNPEKKNMLWGITPEGKLAICRTEEFTKINSQERTHTFKMDILSRPASEKEVKQILDI